MEEDLIAISSLNDFVFCPYSIYLHSVYKPVDTGLYHAMPQINGKSSHFAISNKSYSSSNDYIMELDISSSELGVFGKIDIYNKKTKSLIERKYKLSKIYKGQYYQLWAQYFCMIEMGYEVDNLKFYSYSDNKTLPIRLPTVEDKEEIKKCLLEFKAFNPATFMAKNLEKCTHCVYCNLCDKIEVENVY